MDTINNRYKIIKKIDCLIPDAREFLAMDLWSDNKIVSLKVISFSNISKNPFNFLKEEFIVIKNTPDRFYLKNYGFANLYKSLSSDIIFDPDDKLYICTTEYVDNKIPVTEFLLSATPKDILQIIVEICQGITIIDNLGYRYNTFLLDYIYIIKTKDNFQVRIKDIISTKLENFYSIYKHSNKNRTNDYITIFINLIISLLEKKQIFSNSSKVLSTILSEIESSYINLDENETKYFQCILKVAKKLIKYKNKQTKFEIYKIIVQINNELGTTNVPDIRKPLQSINLRPKIVLTNEYLYELLQALKNIDSEQSTKNIFIVKGPTGVGKTRNLKEVEYSLLLEGTNIYSNYNLKNCDAQSFWDDFFDKNFIHSFSSSSNEEINEIHIKLNKIRIQEKSKKIGEKTSNLKYQLLYQIKKNYIQLSKGRILFTIIDDLQVADSFLLETLLFLATSHIQNEKLGFIISYNESEPPTSPKFNKIVKILENHSNAKVFELNNFSKEKTAELVKNILFINKLPAEIAKTIFEYTSGNPSEIIKTIKEFIKMNIICKNTLTGKWDLCTSLKNNLQLNLIRNNLTKNLKNKIETIPSSKKKLLQYCSLFKKPFKLDYITPLLKISKSNLNNAMQYFLKKGMLTKIENEDEVKYTIPNKQLRDIIYEEISSSLKQKMHRKISEFLKKEKLLNLNELIWHLEKIEENEEVIKYCNKNIKENKKEQNFKEMIKYYKKILKIISKNNIQKSFKTNLELLEIYNKLGLRREAKATIDILSKLAPNIKDPKTLSQYYFLFAKHLHKSNNSKDMLVYLKKLKILYNKTKLPIIKLRLYNASCAYYQIDQKHKKMEYIVNNMLKLIDDMPKYKEYKALAFTLLAYIAYIKHNYDDNIKYSKEAKILAQKYNDVYLEIIAEYNIAYNFISAYQDYKKGIELLKGIIKKANKHNIVSVEIISLFDYISFLIDHQANKKAYKYAKIAKEKAQKNNLVNFEFMHITLLIKITNNLNKYNLMLKYKKEFFDFIKEKKVSTYKIDLFRVYSIFTDLYVKLDLYEKAYYYAKKTLELKDHKMHESIYLIYFKLEAIKVIQNKQTSIDSLLNIFEKYEKEMQKEKMKKRIISKSFLNIVIHLCTKTSNINFKHLIKKILKYTDYCKYSFQKSSFYILESVINKNEEIMLLKKAVNILTYTPDYNFLIPTYIRIALYYMQHHKLYLMTIYFLLAQEKIVEQLKNTPKKYIKYLYIQSEYFITFDIVEYFLKHKNIKNYKFNRKQISNNELEKVMNTNYAEILNKNKIFKDNLTLEVKEERGYKNFNFNHIYIDIDYDYKNNIKNIIDFMSSELLATDYEVFMLDKSGKISPIFNINPKNIKLKKIYAVLKIQDYNKLLKLESSFDYYSLIIPIKNLEIKNKILGFIVFTSDCLVNKFSIDGIKFCKKYINFFALFIQSNNYKDQIIFDKLTGVFSRKQLEHLLNNIYTTSKKNNKEFSLIMFDIDHFKNINDLYGHQTGDRILKLIAQNTISTTEKNQLVCRYGGEEFLIILPDTNKDEAKIIAEKIRTRIENIKYREEKITISLGIASYPEHSTTLESLLLKADQALYTSKNRGRNISTVWAYQYEKNIENTQINIYNLIDNNINFRKNIKTILELLEIPQLHNKKNKKLDLYLKTIIDFFEADSIAILKPIKNSTIKILKEIGIHSYNINKKLINQTAETGIGKFQIDWDDVIKKKIVTNNPEWNSIMIMPLIKNKKINGYIYLTVAEKKHEFNSDDFNSLKIFADIVSANI